ncbi:hypothetical protein C4F40_18450 [Sphingobacterium sp. Ka21]|uniref:CHAT domain-containing protein n=2 Tax=Sphingobacterium pedocola TaxID=2082722 RepID=A0ABR9TBN1_9SPHI|nr:hypothetical protein [Sphingobacterium pedocola]
MDLHAKLSDERLNQHTNNQDEIVELYAAILDCMSNSYTFYKENVPYFLTSLEENNTISVNYEIAKFMQLFEDLMKISQLAPFDDTIINHPTTNESVEKLFAIMKDAYRINNRVRLSEDNLDFNGLSNEELRSIAAVLINLIYDHVDQPVWNQTVADNVFQSAATLRPLMEILKQSEIFYHIMAVISEKLSQSELYQLNRDIAEEIIICGFKENEIDWGYKHSFRVYSNGASVHAGLLYANLSMVAAFNKTTNLNEKYVREIIMQSSQFFRNVNLPNLCEIIYTSIPNHIRFIGAEKRYLEHIHLNSRLLKLDPMIPISYLDYLNEHRESVLSGNLNEAMPCLIALFNIKRHYPAADFSNTSLGYYLSRLEMIVPANYVQKQKAAIFSDSPDIKQYLIESLIKLEQTRNTSDFVYDNDYALKLSGAAIVYGKKSNDFSAFLLGMILKSDFSLLFQSQITSGLAVMTFPEIDIAEMEQKYANHNTLIDIQKNSPISTITWLAAVDNSVYQMNLNQQGFEVFHLTNWSLLTYNKHVKDEYFYNLSFNDTTRDRHGVRTIFPEEHEAEGKLISDTIEFTKINHNISSDRILLVKDMYLSAFPHNLLLDNNGNFIAHSIPVTNVLSTEWYLKSVGFDPMGSSYSKSIWIPTESMDYPLNILLSKIEDTLSTNAFNLYTSKILDKPLNSDINIICSHGANSIAESQIIYQNEEPLYDLDDVVGKGKILIFFVCYSGSMQTEFFRNNTTSLIKKFIKQGYQAVIAPFWALEVTIPGIWLPEFLSAIEGGKRIDEAVFLANKEVYNRFPTPAAWACLHLYGNSDFKMASNIENK